MATKEYRGLACEKPKGPLKSTRKDDMKGEIVQKNRRKVKENGCVEGF